MDTLTLFSKNLNQRSLTPRWPLTPCLLRSHVWLYPRIIVSKSHDNTSMYVDTVINFANYHIHTLPHTYILHTTYRMSDHIVSYWTQFRRDKKRDGGKASEMLCNEHPTCLWCDSMRPVERRSVRKASAHAFQYGIKSNPPATDGSALDQSAMHECSCMYPVWH